MKLETVEDYNNELNDMDKTLTEMEEYIKKHPERLGYAGNYKTLKYIYEIYSQDKIDFVNELNDMD